MPAKRKGSTKPAAKKAKVVHEEKPKTEYDLKLEVIIEALKNEEYPVGADRDMLLLAAPCVFEEFVEERHAHQLKAQEFITTAFAGIRTHLTARCDEQQRIQDSGDAIRAELVAASEAAKASLDEKTLALEGLQAALATKKEALKESKDGLKTAKLAQKDIDEELANAQVSADKFQRGHEEIFRVLRETGPEKSLLKELKAILPELALDATMLANNLSCLAKAASDRGMFDTIALDAAEAAFVARRAEIAKTVEEINGRLSGFLETTNGAQARVDENNSIVEAAQNVVSDASEVKKTATETFKASEKAIGQHDKDVAASGERKIECADDLTKFTEIESTLTWLVARAAPIPEPEIIEEPKPVEGEVAAPADVEMAEAPTVEPTEVPVAEATIESEAPVEEAPIEEIPAQPIVA